MLLRTERGSLLRHWVRSLTVLRIPVASAFRVWVHCIGYALQASHHPFGESSTLVLGYTFAPEHPCWFGALFTFKTLFLSSSREIKLFWERWSQNDLSWQLLSKFQKRSKWPNLFIWNFVRNLENFGWVMLILPLLLQTTMLLAEKCGAAAETNCVNSQTLFRSCLFAPHCLHVLN